MGYSISFITLPIKNMRFNLFWLNSAVHGVLFLRQIVLEMKLFDLEEKSLQKEGGKSGYRPKFVFEILLCSCSNRLIWHFTEVCCRKEFYQHFVKKKGMIKSCHSCRWICEDCLKMAKIVMTYKEIARFPLISDTFHGNCIWIFVFLVKKIVVPIRN